MMAIIDRLLHHGEVFYFRGSSYRMRGKEAITLKGKAEAVSSAESSWEAFWTQSNVMLRLERWALLTKRKGSWQAWLRRATPNVPWWYHGEGKLCSLLLMVRENVHATSHGVHTLLLGLLQNKQPWTDRGEGKAFTEGCTKRRTFVPFFGSSMLSFQYLKAGTSLCLVLEYLRSFNVNSR